MLGKVHAESIKLHIQTEQNRIMRIEASICQCVGGRARRTAEVLISREGAGLVKSKDNSRVSCWL
jgi:hypothetical protein